MLVSLSKNRPKDVSKEEWEKLWNNVGYSLAPFYQCCQELLAGLDKVKEEDFSNPNHYGLLAYRAGKMEMLKEIMKFFPDTAKTT